MKWIRKWVQYIFAEQMGWMVAHSNRPWLLFCTHLSNKKMKLLTHAQGLTQGIPYHQHNPVLNGITWSVDWWGLQKVTSSPSFFWSLNNQRRLVSFSIPGHSKMLTKQLGSGCVDVYKHSSQSNVLDCFSKSGTVVSFLKMSRALHLDNKYCTDSKCYLW